MKKTPPGTSKKTVLTVKSARFVDSTMRKIVRQYGNVLKQLQDK